MPLRTSGLRRGRTKAGGGVEKTAGSEGLREESGGFTVRSES